MEGRMNMRLTRALILACMAMLFGLASMSYLGDSSDQLERARTQWFAREYAQALATLKAMDDPASDPEVLQLMGDCYKGLKDWPQAIKCFEQILTCKDSPFRVQDVKSWIMDCYLANNEPYKALNTLEKLAAEYPDDAPKFYWLVGRRYQWMGQYAEGAKYFKQALKMPKTDPLAKDAARRFICCSLSAMDWDGALTYLPTFVSDFPDSAPEILSAELDRWKFKTLPAIQVVEKVVAETRGEDKLKLKIGLADCYAAVREWDKARSLLNSVPKSSQQRSAEWHAAMAKCCWGQDKTKEAMTELKEAIKLEGRPEWKKLLMVYYRDSGDNENMLAQAVLLEKELPEETSEWLINQGWAYLDMKQYDKAVPIFRDCISRFPDQRWIIRGAQVSLAECLYRLGKGEQALADLKDYYKARPELQCEYLLLYGQVMYHGARDYAASIAALKKLLADCAGDPLAADARQFLVRVLQTAGRSEEAAEVLRSSSADIPVWRSWDQAELLRSTADMYFRAKDYGRAADTYRELVQAKSGSQEAQAAAIYRLAVCEHEMGNLDSALGHLRRVIAEFPNTSTARQASGSLYVWTHFGQKEREGTASPNP
jgi:tetratricopeptide (TPR) repeat protein